MSSAFTRQRGFISGTAVALIAFVLLFVGAAAFGVWAFMGRQDYKDNSNQKSAAAASAAVTKTQAEDATKYAEEAKNPLKTYVGPAAFGQVTVQYPKTWSGYVVNKTSGSQPVNDYFQPDVVPDVTDKANAYALRIEVVTTSYDKVLDGLKRSIEQGSATASPYTPDKVPSVAGTRINGVVRDDKRGSMVILPLRNDTLKVWTESEQFVPDFDNIVLASLSFSP